MAPLPLLMRPARPVELLPTRRLRTTTTTAMAMAMGVTTTTAMTNRRNYDFGSTLEMASDQNEIQRLISDPNEEVRLEASKAHRKMEVHGQFLEEDSKCPDASNAGAEVPADGDLAAL